MAGMTLRDALEPAATLLEELAAAAQTILLDVLPRADSPAMEELAHEAPYRTAGTQTPLANAATHAGLLGYAAADAARAFAHLLRHDDLFLWSPAHVARAGLDAAAYAFWLIEPGIGVEARVQRQLTFRLFNARNQALAPKDVPGVRDHVQRTIECVKADASALGWKMSGRKKRPQVGSQELPQRADAIHAVLSYRHNDAFDGIARVVWWFYSGLTHSAPWALLQFADPQAAEPTGIEGVNAMPLMISGPHLVSTAGTLGRVLSNLAYAHAALLGISDDTLTTTDERFTATIVGLLERMEAAEESDRT